MQCSISYQSPPDRYVAYIRVSKVNSLDSEAILMIERAILMRLIISQQVKNGCSRDYGYII